MFSEISICIATLLLLLSLFAPEKHSTDLKILGVWMMCLAILFRQIGR